ncbi:hypothetical protein SLEP1_g50953 [Rubroshorea leprosula]|uniref:Reverse transcriptase domain-containing protein n=1 Tax=Rubroshorea leprosula TaxID=152421 RepID=A0AAV5M569_9ROSI|nr:hypothetical protein SLEP1_g50953 [Rubroshorea leprosula]
MSAFFVVDTVATYNALLGRDWIHSSWCVPSSLHQKLIFWNGGKAEVVSADNKPFSANTHLVEARYYEEDIGTIRFFGMDRHGKPIGITACSRPSLSKRAVGEEREKAVLEITKKLAAYFAEKAVQVDRSEIVHEGDEADQDDEITLEELDLAPAKLDDLKAEVQDPLEEINLGSESEPKVTFVSGSLEPQTRDQIVRLLHEFKDCFAWDYSEMPGLDRKLVEHKLPIAEGFRPYKQPPRRMFAEVTLKVKKEIERLVKAGFIRTCRYADWLSNVVPVLKKNGKLRVCVDFRNLNLATPKDEYPMPIADLLVDGVACHKILSFMDGHSGYNQIFIADADVPKTAFRCPSAVGTFEWVVMPFGLKNAGATYQRAMNAIFHDMIGKFMEIYIDDVVVKSNGEADHLVHLRKSFERMRQHGLKMNPLKCAFGVSAGNFLGYLVHERGLEVDKNKARAVIEAKPPQNKKELQRFLGQVNFLRRFISNLAGKTRVFSPLLKLKSEADFKWEEHHQSAFDMIKRQLSKLESIDLSRNQLSGSIPDSIGQLSQLESIDLSYNRLSGSIPFSIRQLSKLESIDLSCNQLSESIPDSIKQLSKLKSIDLSSNQLNGRIPNSIRQLSKLESIDLSSNQLSGSIQDGIKQLSKLKSIDLSSNKLSGSIPDSIKQLSKLESIDLFNNQLSGSIPDSIGQLSQLESVDLAHNRLSGSIPFSIKQLSKLESIYLCRNQLSESIPDSIKQLSKLKSIDLSNNQLSGSIPDSIGQLFQLESIDLSHNQLSGSIPNSIKQLSKLKSIDLADNQLSGSILDSIVQLSKLEYLFLSGDPLNMSIPYSIGQLSKLKCLYLSGNQLSGSIPDSIGQLSELRQLSLVSNQLRGSIPNSIMQLSKLMSLDLSSNQLSGSIPHSIAKLSKLKFLDLSKNQLSGSIPDSIGQLSELKQILLSSNQLTGGRIPPCFGKFPIMVNATQLMKRITDNYWSWAHLKEVVKGRYLEYTRKTLGLESSIDLSRKIPEKIGQMENLESLDFSQNGLSGTIPNSMSSLTKLSHLNLSYNNLSGPIPTGYQLQTLEDPTIYVGNPQLCGAPLLKKCSNDVLPPPTDNLKDNDEGALTRMWFYIVVMLGFATGFWGVVGTLIFVKTWRYAYFRWVDDVQHWILVVITLKVARVKKMFNGNPDDQ